VVGSNNRHKALTKVTASLAVTGTASRNLLGR
jgi:hypothetical protein